MAKMVGRQQLNSQTTMHSHKPTVHGMVMVQLRILQDMRIIKHKQYLALSTRDSKDINHTHDNYSNTLVDHTHIACYVILSLCDVF